MTSKALSLAKIIGDNNKINLQSLPQEATEKATPSFSNSSSFPTTGNTIGDLVFAQDTKALYVWDGTEWDRISSGINEVPIFTTEPLSSYELSSVGNTIVTIAAFDPEGFPIEYSHVTNPSNQKQATITNTGGTFTFVPSSNTSDNEGTFTCRFRASDGTHVSTRTSTFSLVFYNNYAAEYLSLTSGNLISVTYSGSGTDNLDATIDASSDGDAILLTAGTYEINPTNWDGYSASNWRGKNIAIVGMVRDPADVVLNLNDAGTRDKAIFAAGTIPTNYYNHFANMRIVRLGDPVGVNYQSALKRDACGGYVQNCIIDLNGNEVSFIYDNAGTTTPVGSFINCSFVNYNSWLNNYSGNSNSLRIVDCAFSTPPYQTDMATMIGSNQNLVQFDQNYSYADGGSNYGHLKGITDTPTVSITSPV